MITKIRKQEDRKRGRRRRGREKKLSSSMSMLNRENNAFSLAIQQTMLLYAKVISVFAQRFSCFKIGQKDADKGTNIHTYQSVACLIIGANIDTFIHLSTRSHSP